MTHVEAMRAFLASYDVTQPKKTATEAYMGSTAQILGVSTPAMHAFVAEWTKQHRATLTFADWVATLDALYHGATYEEKVMAGSILARFPVLRRQLPLTQLDSWLDQLNGWAEVDNTCQSGFTDKDVLANWEAWQSFLRQLAQSPNINKRRAALVLLVYPIRTSTDTRLITLALEQVNQLKSENDKLISKAVSWVLREAIKKHRDAITAYIDAEGVSLPKSVLREVQTKLTTGKKTP